MSTLSIANAAGSAGKTTTAVALGALIAQSGRTARIIDCDPQGNATHATGAIVPAGGPTIADILSGTRTITDAELDTVVPGLTVVPAQSATLEGIETTLSRTVGAEQRLRLALESAVPVDVTIIDCPGSIGLLTVTALVASDAAFTVAMPTVKELAGLPRIEGVIEQVRLAYRPRLRLVGVLPCKVPPRTRGRLYTEALELLHKQWGDRVTPSVRDSVRVPEAYAARTPLPAYEPTAPVTADYRAVLACIDAGGMLG
ncbi:ParA family protein [Nakamurella lactea]|uniref:ParA family protein n=1 Tax=Nakamurella lactea TaxID=459515 RepID=UPI0003F72ACC|nr:ParA family protein [Nakamurella lactea]